MYEFSKKELDVLILFLDSIIEPDLKYSKTIQKSIFQSKNTNISNEKIEEIALKKQNLRDSIYLVDKHINNFQGIMCERIEMFIYNYLKNSADVITITNPEGQSKADLIHIFDKGKYSISSCGPDIKYGDPIYVVNEYIKKHLEREDSSGFIDISGYLDPKSYKVGVGFKKLTKGQNKKVLGAISKFSYKPATMPLISKTQYQQINAYYLQYISTGILPSKSNKEDFYKLYAKMTKNEIGVCDLSIDLTIVQNEIKISEIKDLMETIRNADFPNMDEETVRKDNTSEKKQKTRSKLDENKVKINPKIVIGVIGTGVLMAVAASPKGRAAMKKALKVGNNKLAKVSLPALAVGKKWGDGRKAVNNVIKEINVDEIVSKVINQIDADKVSAFSPILKMFNDGIITRDEFFAIGGEIQKRTGKQLKSYLGLMKNFHKSTAASILLE